MTFIPTAKPASSNLSHLRGDESSTRSARAKKSIPIAITCEATPQQAVEKKCELSAVANPPRIQAIGTNFSCLKKVQAPSPRIKSENGANIFEKRTGPV